LICPRPRPVGANCVRPWPRGALHRLRLRGARAPFLYVKKWGKEPPKGEVPLWKPPQRGDGDAAFSAGLRFWLRRIETPTPRVWTRIRVRGAREAPRRLQSTTASHVSRSRAHSRAAAKRADSRVDTERHRTTTPKQPANDSGAPTNCEQPLVSPRDSEDSKGHFLWRFFP
jgi:hypothetical protein